MDTHNKRLSTSSSSILEPFDNHQSQQSMPWFCYLCGTNAAEIGQRANIQKREKITLSKTNRNSKQQTMRKSIISEDGFGTGVDKNNYIHNSVKTTSQLKFTVPNLAGFQNRQSTTQLNTQPIENKQVYNSQIYMNSSIHPQQKVRTQIKSYTGNFVQNQVFYQRNSQPMVNTTVYTSTLGSHILPYNSGLKNTDTSRMKKSMTFSYGNPIPQSEIQQRKTNVESKQNVSQLQTNESQRKITLTSCKSSEIIQCHDAKLNSPQHPPSNISTQEDIPPPFTQFREVVSIDDANEQKLQFKKEKASNQSRTPKFLRNLKKKSSSSQSGQMRRSSDLQASNNSYIQFGNKIKIGIRKVQSINSQNSDEDQYSEVLSHGERSFLMPEINEVEEMSRVSSMSAFKNWEDDQV